MKVKCYNCGREFDDEVDGVTYSLRGGRHSLCCDCLESYGYTEHPLGHYIEVCQECGEWHGTSEIVELSDGRRVCKDCAERLGCFKCHACGCWHYESERREVRIADCTGFWMDTGNATVSVCESCWESKKVKCSQCGEWIYAPYGLAEHDGEGWCPDCIDGDSENWVTCEECGGRTHVDDAYSARRVRDDGSRTNEYVDLCESCWDDYAYACDGCGETLWPLRNLRDYGDEHYCSECFDDRFIECDRCGEIVDRDDAHLVHVGRNDETWCESCRDEHSFVCEGCRERYSDDYLCEHGDEYYCEDCCPSDDDDMEEFVHNYSYKPSPVFSSCGDDMDMDVEPYIGFELEAGGAGGCDAADAAEHICDEIGEDFVYLKSDSSIPDYGFEMVTHPMSLKYHETEAQWERMLEICRSRGMKSHDFKDRNCGLHVHLTREMLDDSTWRVIDAFVNLNQADFEKLGRRRSQHYYEYMEGVPGQEHDRYRAVNFCNCRTIEFRFMNGSLIHNTLLASLELAHSLWMAGKVLEDAIRTGGTHLSIPSEGSKFEDYAEAVVSLKAAWVELVGSNPRYARLLAYARDKGAFWKELSGCGDLIERGEPSEDMRESAE